MPFKNLIAGYKSFLSEHRSLFKQLAQGQAPDTLVISCSDSRTDPALITRSNPGEMFVVRNVAGIVPPYKADTNHHGTSAAIEFAVKTLKVKHIVVMGHSGCGGIQALADRETARQKYEFLAQWVDIGAPALATVEQQMHDAPPALRQRALEQSVILISLENLMTFPWIKQAVDNGEIDMHGWYLDIQASELLAYDRVTQSFGPLGKQKASA